MATHYHPIYWDTACLIVNSGAIDPENEGQTNYDKIATAVGNIRSAGVNVSLTDINNSDFGFKPDVEHNQILFGFKGMTNVSGDTISAIIEHRPYTSIKDFTNKVKLKKQTMISLIKGGAFDLMEDRRFTMAWYLWQTCGKKDKLTMQNMGAIIEYDLIPKEEEFEQALRVYYFNKYLKAICKLNATHYQLDERALNFIYEKDFSFLIEDNNIINQKKWDKVYQKEMNVFRNWLAENQKELLQILNQKLFQEEWNKYAKGNISSWEMDSLCFYYHEHELANINKEKYGIVSFNDLPEEPEVDEIKHWGNRDITYFKLHKICGTCIARDKTKAIVTLLTPDGVVHVKFRKEHFSLFDKRISEVQPDGKKKVKEKSWFARGSKIMVMGIRSGDNFISKKYKKTQQHQLYKIEEVLPNGDLLLRDKRYQGEEEEDNEE